MQKKNFSVIGKPLRKIDAMAKCAGETLYADDLNLPRMIYAKLLRSPHPHARILGINTARAEAARCIRGHHRGGNAGKVRHHAVDARRRSIGDRQGALCRRSRSEERRVGKEWRSRWSPDDEKKKEKPMI